MQEFQHPVSSNFREEVMAIGFSLVITVVASFFLYSRVFAPTNPKPDPSKVLGQQDSQTQSDVAFEAIESTSTPQPTPSPIVVSTPTPTPAATLEPTPIPTSDPNSITINYGQDQVFENDNYAIAFSEPKLTVGDSKIYSVEIVLANKTVTAGINSKKIFATVIKGETIMTEEAPMTISESKIVMPNQKLTYTAQLSIFQGTDISKLVFEPGGDLISTTYSVGP